MGDVGDLVVRMIVSLAIVLAIIAAAYGVARRRTGRPNRTGRTVLGRRQRVPEPTLEVEARAGLARGAAAVAVRFADRIVLVGVTDGAASTVLAEISAEEWDRVPDPEPEPVPPASEPDVTGPANRTPFDPNGIVSERPSFLDALRDVTSRRP